MKNLTVNISKKYDVVLGYSLLDSTINYIKEIVSGKKLAIITDDIVDNLYSDKIDKNLKKNNFEISKFVFRNGESSKNINTLSDILEFLAECNFKRNDIIIALGGGVVGDITGLAASLYMRGIKFIQIPTTLLAMVDASIGGKTAIDLKNGKNLAGAFWQPSLVICDCEIIRNLPDRLFAEGMAEVIKCGAIRKTEIIDYVLNNRVKEYLEEIIEACISLKRDVVEADEFETKGIRQILNVGHTVAHAIEKTSNYTVSHGLAVGTGLVIEANIAKQIGILKDDTDIILKECVDKYNLYLKQDYDIESFVNAMKNDKKNNDKKIVFMLPEKIGKYKEYKLSEQEIKTILNQIKKENK